MAFNYRKLKGRVIETFRSQIEFAKAMNWSERTLSLKMNGKTSWKQADICQTVDKERYQGQTPTPLFYPEIYFL